MRKPTILAIETSCDETGVAVLRRNENIIEVLAQAVASQVDIHAVTGGVVPEVAAREHVAVLPLLLANVMKEAGLTTPDAVAVTIGPGLQPALAVGVTAARTLAYAWGKPVIPVHHLEGHIYSALLESAEKIPNPPAFGRDPATGGGKHQIPNKFEIPKPAEIFPALALIVSGGHTMLVLVRGHLQYDVVGSTKDDAAGEAFDKVARLLELPYPGGPHLSALAQQGDPQAFTFTRPMLTSGNLNFSFSGLKTAVLYAWRAIPDEEKDAQRAAMAASFERVVVETLVAKTRQALAAYQPRLLLLAGGVAANQPLRDGLAILAQEQNVPLSYAPLALCGDNAVMIGLAAVLAHAAGRVSTPNTIDAHPRLALTDFGRHWVTE